MAEIYQLYALDIFKINLGNTQYTPELRYACGMPEKFLIYTRDILEISMRYAWNKP